MASFLSNLFHPTGHNASRRSLSTAHPGDPSRSGGSYPSQTRKLVSALRSAGFFGRGGYNVVYGPDQWNRKFVSAETGGESDQLTQSERNRLIAFARQLARNSEETEAILHQFEVNVVGISGGKAVFDIPSTFAGLDSALPGAFANWAQSAEFFDDLSLGTLLKLALRTQLLGGDLVLVFDDNLVEDSGQIIAFEPDCIGNLSEADFQKLFAGKTQTQGIIKSANGKTVGAIVSWSQRGQTEYRLYDDKGRVAAWPLIKSAATPWRDSLFILHRSVGRFNQGHGSSGLWPSFATLQDLTDLRGYEMQAAKKNSQTVGQLIQERQQAEALSGDLNPDSFAPAIDGEDSGALPDADEDLESVDFEVVRAAGAIIDAMPPGVKMELFDTKHPNANMPQFIKWLQRSAAWAKGLGSVYATGEATASFSATQAEMLITQKTFDDEWHRLECGILDWAIRRWYFWALRKGLIPKSAAALPDDWTRTFVSWMRPQKREINPADEQNAINSGIKNGTITYREKLGADWKRKLRQVAEEIDYCKQINFPHLANQTVSGQVITTSKEEANIDE